MGTSALRSHLKINRLGPDPGSICLALSLNDTGAVHVHGIFYRVLKEDEDDEPPSFFLDGTYAGRWSPSWYCCHSDGCTEDVERVVHVQSHSSPSKHTWTSARFASWLPESSVSRAGHRRDLSHPSAGI